MGVCLPHPEHLSPCASPSLHEARAQNSLKPQCPTHSGSGPKMGQEPAVRISRTQQERGEKGGQPAGVLKGCGPAAPVGGGGQARSQTAPSPWNPLGFKPRSPTLPPTSRPPWYSPNLSAQQLQDGGGWRRGFVATGPTPDPSPPRRTSPQCLRPPLSVAAKTFSQQVFRESRQKRPALNIKVFQRSKKKKKRKKGILETPNVPTN